MKTVLSSLNIWAYAFLKFLKLGHAIQFIWTLEMRRIKLLRIGFQIVFLNNVGKDWIKNMELF